MIGSHSWTRRICRIGAALLLLGLVAQSNIKEPFGLASVGAPANDPWWALWQDLQSKIESEKPIIAQCRAEPVSCGSPAALRFIAIVNEGAGYEGLARIGRINRAINFAIRSKDQSAWMSPLAALASGEGDCKQYAIIKYAAMGEAGFAPDDLKLIVGDIKSPRRSHAVVTVRHEQRWLILDNRSLELVDSSELPNYLPLYAFDHRGVRRFVLPASPEIASVPCDSGLG